MSENGFPHTAPVTIVGAGPVGLVTAYTLAKHGIRCNLIEKHVEATIWPKMDVTNARSMELLDRLGLAKEFRQIGKRLLRCKVRQRCMKLVQTSHDFHNTLEETHSLKREI